MLEINDWDDSVPSCLGGKKEGRENGKKSRAAARHARCLRRAATGRRHHERAKTPACLPLAGGKREIRDDSAVVKKPWSGPSLTDLQTRLFCSRTGEPALPPALRLNDSLAVTLLLQG